MSSDYWELAYESEEYKHWESDYLSPELVAITASGILAKNAKILDVGSGGGNDAIFMAQCGFDVIGLDISTAAPKIAETRAEKVQVTVDWRRGSVLDLPIKDASIDFVTDRGLFHLIEDGDRPKYAAELYRVLKARGRILIRGASKESGHDRFNPVTEQSIKKYFATSRFKIGPVLPIPLYSVVGVMDGRLVVLQKTRGF